MTLDKANLLKQCLGATRYVWNYFLAENQRMMEAYRADPSNSRPNTTFFSLGKEFTQLRRTKDWLGALPFAPIRYVLKYQADAWQQCFRSGKGFPKFKSRWYDTDSVTFPAGSFKLNDRSLHLAKIGQVVISGNNPYANSEPVSVVIREECRKFYATVCHGVKHVDHNQNSEVLGIDRNVGQFATSEGEIRYLPDLSKLESRRRRYQRMMARRRRPNRKKEIKPSHRYLKAKQLAAKTSRKIAHIRNDWQHQESRRIADHFQFVVIESLNTQGMTRSAKGTIEQPGKQVRAKSGLNRSILATGWSSFKLKLAYKAELIEVEPKHTSQKCHLCGHIEKENRKTRTKFECVRCGYSGNADINAALNILALGQSTVLQDYFLRIYAILNNFGRFCRGGSAPRPPKYGTFAQIR